MSSYFRIICGFCFGEQIVEKEDFRFLRCILVK